MSDILACIFTSYFIFSKEILIKKYFKTNKMSTQKDIKTPDTKGEKTGNITAYSKAKLSGKPICRKTIKPITQQLKVNGKTLKESLLDLPRFTLYFILHGKVIQQ